MRLLLKQLGLMNVIKNLQILFVLFLLSHVIVPSGQPLKSALAQNQQPPLYNIRHGFSNFNQFAIIDKTMAVADGANGISLFDLSTPSSPKFLGSKNFSIRYLDARFVRNVSGYFVAYNGNSGDLFTIDVNKETVISTLSLSSINIYRMIAYQNYLLVIGTDGIFIYSVNTSGKLIEESSTVIRVIDAVIVNNMILASNNTGLYISKFSTKNLVFQRLQNGTLSLTKLLSIGDHVYFYSSHTLTDFLILNNTANFQKSITFPFIPVSLFISNSFRYFVTQNGFVVLNEKLDFISTPQNSNLFKNVNQALFRDNFVYMTFGVNGFKIFEKISNITFKVIFEFNLPSDDFQKVALNVDILAIYSLGEGIYNYQIKTDSKPQLISFIPIYSHVYQISFLGKLLLINTNNTITFFDYSDPVLPKFIQDLRFQEQPLMSVYGQNLAIRNGSDVLIYNISPPQNFVLSSNLPISKNVSTIYINDKSLVVGFNTSVYYYPQYTTNEFQRFDLTKMKQLYNVSLNGDLLIASGFPYQVGFVDLQNNSHPISYFGVNNFGHKIVDSTTNYVFVSAIGSVSLFTTDRFSSIAKVADYGATQRVFDFAVHESRRLLITAEGNRGVNIRTFRFPNQNPLSIPNLLQSLFNSIQSFIPVILLILIVSAFLLNRRRKKKPVKINPEDLKRYFN